MKKKKGKEGYIGIIFQYTHFSNKPRAGLSQFYTEILRLPISFENSQT